VTDRDAAAVAREIIDANQYMVLATADREGVPWISPVWFAHDGYRQLLWISRPGRRHSRNIEVRPVVAISIFDSTQPIGTGHGVTMSAAATVLDGEALVRATEIVSRRSMERGGGMFTVGSFKDDASLRLYRATAVEQFVVLGNDERVPVEL
jgi:uncharacterized protein YhbP (UPF0306 family)